MADTKQDVILVLLACFSTDLLTPTYQLRHVNSRILLLLSTLLTLALINHHNLFVKIKIYICNNRAHLEIKTLFITHKTLKIN